MNRPLDSVRLDAVGVDRVRSHLLGRDVVDLERLRSHDRCRRELWNDGHVIGICESSRQPERAKTRQGKTEQNLSWLHGFPPTMLCRCSIGGYEARGRSVLDCAAGPITHLSRGRALI